MRKLHEVISRVATSAAAGKDEKLKLLWVLGRYNQIRDFGVSGDYDDDGSGELKVHLWFQGDDNAETAHALTDYVAELIKSQETISVWSASSARI
jgi:hypothetical protein